MARLFGKIAIVTGASGGIGSAAVRLFVEQGAKVLAVDKHEDAIATALEGLDANAVSYFAADVTKEAEVDAYTQAAITRYGGIDVVLLNAGVLGDLLPLTEYPVEMFDQVTTVNMRGPWLGMRAAFPHLKRRGGGSIVLTSSVQGLSAIQHTSGYTASKHAVAGQR